LALNAKERAEIWKECFDKLLYTEETKKLIALKRKSVALKRAFCGEEEECGPEKGLLWRRGSRILLLLVVVVVVVLLLLLLLP
jgi:hypothetical protein